VIADGTPAEVLAHPAVIASYLGTDNETVARSGQRRSRTTAPRKTQRKATVK
jgi:hypothetical protein